MQCATSHLDIVFIKDFQCCLHLESGRSLSLLLMCTCCPMRGSLPPYSLAFLLRWDRLSCANEHGQTQTTVTRSLSLALIKGKARPCFSLLSCLSTTRSCKARPARGHQHPRGRGRSSAGARTRMSTLQPPPSPGQGRGPTMTVRPDSTSSLHPPSTKSHIQLCTPTARHLFQGRLSIGNTPPETFEEKAKHLATSFI